MCSSSDIIKLNYLTESNENVSLFLPVNLVSESPSYS